METLWSTFNDNVGDKCISGFKKIVSIYDLSENNASFWSIFNPAKPDYVGDCISAFQEMVSISAHGNDDENGALKASFWSIFNPGNPDYVGDNCKYNMTTGAHDWTPRMRTVGLSMWAIFQLINIVVLLNLCVALMNRTIGKLNKEKDSVWKMNRADAWMMFFNQKDLPIPFNLLSLIFNLLKFVFKCQGHLTFRIRPMTEKKYGNKPKGLKVTKTDQITNRNNG